MPDLPPSPPDSFPARAAFIDLLQSAATHASVSTFTLEDDAIVEPSSLLDDIGRAGLTPIVLDRPAVRVFEDEALMAGTLAGRGRDALQLSAETLAALQAYDWPGNVRELENALERAAVLTARGEIGPEALPSRVTSPRASPIVSDRLPPNPPLEIIERAYIHWVLQAEAGNKTRTAEILGIDPSTLYRKLLRYGMAE